MQPGQYTLLCGDRCNGNWFNSDTNVTGSLNICRLNEKHPWVVSTVKIDLRPEYRVYLNDDPLDMVKEVSWIVQFVSLLPEMEMYLPCHFIEKMPPARFWKAQVDFSSQVMLKDEWDPVWQDVFSWSRTQSFPGEESYSTSVCT